MQASGGYTRMAVTTFFLRRRSEGARGSSFTVKTAPRTTWNWRRTVQQGWQGNLCHHRQGFGVSSAGLPGSGNEAATVPDDEHFVGRGDVRPDARWKNDCVLD